MWCYSLQIVAHKNNINVCNAAKILQRLEAFTQSSVKVDASRGGAFVLFNGNVTGKFQELVGHSGKIYVFYVQQ